MQQHPCIDIIHGIHIKFNKSEKKRVEEEEQKKIKMRWYTRHQIIIIFFSIYKINNLISHSKNLFYFVLPILYYLISYIAIFNHFGTSTSNDTNDNDGIFIFIEFGIWIFEFCY